MMRGSNCPTQRMLRVGEDVRRTLASILERNLLRDPVIANFKVTVSEVRMSNDLKLARVFVSPFAVHERSIEAVVKGLNRASQFLRSLLAAETERRTVPVLRFEVDQSLSYAGRIEALLHSPKVARDLQLSMQEKDGPS